MKRYAVYYAPEAGDFADFAASWLGWDAETGCARPHPDLPLPVAEITAVPRKYGIHATLKPPFRLNCRFEDLDADLTDLSARLAPVTLDGLDLMQIAGFLALCPVGDTAALDNLAADVVRGLDHLRAPLMPEERARRRPEALSPHQRDLLDRWGYPYVLDQFRFHITLTGALPSAQLNKVEAVLRPILAPLLPRPFRVRQICLFGEAQDGRLHLMRRYGLTGSPA
jgi:putative phosphonate metabolism protein